MIDFSCEENYPKEYVKYERMKISELIKRYVVLSYKVEQLEQQREKVIALIKEGRFVEALLELDGK
ncbi:MAG: hypothetical protein J6S85_03045 [Methanobrevibacter sp.]|nr:hypothetical protein [Methanobrevibacter sp.]